MTNESKMEMYQSMIDKLDMDHLATVGSQQAPIGNRLAVHNQVGINMVTQRTYENDRRKLVELLNDSKPLSKSIQEYLAPKITHGKIDVIDGVTTIDRSMETIGKSL